MQCVPKAWSLALWPPRGPEGCSYPHVLVGELLHLLLVQAGQEELVLQLLGLLESQQGGVGAGLDKALSDPQVHGDSLRHSQGDAQVHSSWQERSRENSVIV